MSKPLALTVWMELARGEDRLLITLDMHFSNVFLFPPSECPGIIVIRARPAVPSKVDQAIKCFLQVLQPEKVRNALITIEENKVRIKEMTFTERSSLHLAARE
jgi:predicted nuclease of predicted toxin-antitoxin system